MKTSIFALIFMAGILCLGSCKKDDSNSNNTSGVAKIHSTNYYTNGVLYHTSTLEYNSSGKAVKLTSTDGSFVTLTYGTNSVVVTYYDSVGATPDVTTYTLNNNGLAISETGTFKKGSGKSILSRHFKLSSKGTYVVTYAYDNNNYKIQEIFTESGNSDTTSYTISNGNTISTITSWYTSTNQFLTDKTNTIGFENMGISFWGKQDKNLISSNTTDYGTGPQTDTYTYEYDSNGRVTKMTNSANPLDYETYSYN